MKLIKLTPKDYRKSPVEEFNDLLVFPVEGIECLIFSNGDIFRFRRLFSFLKPLGHNIAIVNISEKPPELYDVVQMYPKVIYIDNGNMFVDHISKSALLYLFSIEDRELEKELNEGIIPDEFGKMFQTKGISPFETTTITKESEDKWGITDEEKKNTYFVRKENERLNIYALLTSSLHSEIVNESFPLLERYTDMEGNVNPLLIFTSLIKRKLLDVNILEKIAQIGFPYKKIIEKNRRKIVDDRIFELIPKQSEGLIYSGFKKEVDLLLEQYSSLFGVLTRARGIKENIPNFIEKKVNDEVSKYRITKSLLLKPVIRSLILTISHRDEAILRDIVGELRKHPKLTIDMEHQVSMDMELELIEITAYKSRMFIKEIERWDRTFKRILYQIRVELSGEIPITTFERYKEDIIRIFQNIFGEIVPVGEDFEKHPKTSGNATKVYKEESITRSKSKYSGEITLRLVGIGLLIPPKYFKSDYATFLNFIDKYELQIKTAAQRRKVFLDYGDNVPIDIEFYFGEKLTGISSYKRRQNILENAHPLTKIAVRYIVNEYYLKGKDLLLATKKAIEDDIEFLKTRNISKYLFSWDDVPGNDSERFLRFLWDDLDIGWAENAEIHKSNDGKTIRIFKDENSAEIMIDEGKEKATFKISDGRTHDLKVKKENGKLNMYISKYSDLRRYANKYDDEIVRLLVNKKPPIIAYDIDQCAKYHEINNKYLGFTKESETLRSFERLLDIKAHLREASYSKEFRNYLYIYKTILVSMGIEDDSLEELLFSIKFFFV